MSTDQQARQDAVDVSRSVIVQAPAGSGKTTLLVERFVRLLERVTAPEEILAITFTRKAAAEMRLRVMDMLDPDYSPQPHEQAAYDAAGRVRRSHADWRLRDNPGRLMIRTIDSFNHFLARAMPIASQLGPVPEPADSNQALYRSVARRLLMNLPDDDPAADSLATLLRWRDNNSQDIEDLIASLLARREQWLPVVLAPGADQRAVLEQSLEDYVEQQMRSASQALHRALGLAGLTQLCELLWFAADSRLSEGDETGVVELAGLQQLPAADAGNVEQWRLIASQLLLGSGAAFRKRVDKRNGFPPGEQKQAYQALLEQLAEHPSALPPLQAIRRAPRPEYDDDEWQVLQALITLLRRAAQEFQLRAAENGRTDFSGIARAALHGLGDADQPTDLALYLDHRIQHILVDEFQDTNRSQLQLLEKLTAGWQASDGRTLFIVGDPMQSIYRFREADVGLFLQTREYGIGNVKLDPLQLTANYRSRREIVDWVNTAVAPAFPTVDEEDFSSGAIAYASSDAARDSGGAIVEWCFDSAEGEAAAIADHMLAVLQENAHNREFRAAIIVRARSHLQHIAGALDACEVRYRALKLDALTAQPVVQDLLAITRLARQPEDAGAFLSILRAPCIGLTLADLHDLVGDKRSPFDPDADTRLSAAAQARARPGFTLLKDMQDNWLRTPIALLVEGAWRRLGGAALYGEQHQDAARQNSRLYLDALSSADAEGLLTDWNDFLESLGNRFTAGDEGNDNADVGAAGDVAGEESEDTTPKVDILTMHGAKGLEWDLVVLPGLNRQPRGDQRALLNWLPYTKQHGEEGMLVAPIRASAQQEDTPIIETIKQEQKKRAEYERQRLLYVATTRAKEQLVLTAHIKQRFDKEGALKPPEPTNNTLLAVLWSQIGERMAASYVSIANAAADPSAAPTSSNHMLTRIEPGWQPQLRPAFTWQADFAAMPHEEKIEFNWAGADGRRIGTVLHRLLEAVGRQGVETLDAAGEQGLIDKVPHLLAQAGCSHAGLERATAAVTSALQSCLADDTGRWLLSGRHSEAGCEEAVSGIIDGQLVNAVIDRTFVDSDGVRWIVDYKSGYRAGGDIEAFIEQERERYGGQLQRYRQLYQALQDRPVQTALYLPRHQRLVRMSAD